MFYQSGDLVECQSSFHMEGYRHLRVLRYKFVDSSRT